MRFKQFLFILPVLLVCLISIHGNTAFATGTANQSQEAFTFAFTARPKSLKASKSYTIKTNAPAGSAVRYSVSNTKYAKINSKGVLTGKQVGTVTVTAVCQEQTIQCKVKIKGKKTIYLDPGHQRYANSKTEPVGPGSSIRKAKVTGGATGTATRIPEYKFTLTLAKKLKAALVKEGYAVVMSRTSNNVNISNVERAKKGNKSGADICIRIHADSIGNSSVTGASVLYASSSNKFYIRRHAKKSKKLAAKLIKSYCKATGIKNRGIVVRNDLSGTNWSRIPTVLIECGFMSNAKEDKKINNSKFQKKMVKGMVNGIDAYFGY
jgi:N-acetylmuramoyl-L-alanine amidase